MSEVKRYRFANGRDESNLIDEVADGDFVYFSDYNTLATENTNLTHDLERHVQACSDLATENAALRAEVERLKGELNVALAEVRASKERPWGP